MRLIPTQDLTISPFINTPIRLQILQPLARELGSSTFAIQDLKDTITLIRWHDTTQVHNVVRITSADNSFGDRLLNMILQMAIRMIQYSDNLFRGFSIKADPTGNALSYFNMTDLANTKLTFIFITTQLMHPRLIIIILQMVRQII